MNHLTSAGRRPPGRRLRRGGRAVVLGTALACAAAPALVSTSAHAALQGRADGRSITAPSPTTAAATSSGQSAAAGRSKPTATAHRLDARTQALMKRQAALLPVAGKLLAARARAGSDIAGVTIDVAAGRVDVYRTHPAASAGVALPKGVTLVTHRAAYSAGQLTASTRKIQSQSRTLASQGVRVAAVSAREDGSGLDVTVLAATAGLPSLKGPAAAKAPRALSADASRAVLRSAYDGVVASVSTTATATPAHPYYAGWRFNDYSPWYGGDRILEGCTTGFPAIYNGAMKMMTAAHCGGNGTVFHNGPNSSGGWGTLGSVVYNNGNTDIAVIDVASSVNSINVGPAQNSSIRAVAAWEHPVVGSYLCQSGSYTGETCGLRVVDTNQSQCISWFLWWCTSYQQPMTDVVNSAGSGSYAAGHGDSGAPVYWYDAVGNVHAVGQVHGQLFPNARAAYPAYFTDTMWCPAPEGWQQRCSAGFSLAQMPGY